MLSVKVGEVLLALGALHLMNLAIFRRIRRHPAALTTGPASAGRRRLRRCGSVSSRASRRVTPRTYIDLCGRA